MIQRMAKLLGGSLTGQLVTFGAAFALTRVYGPEAFAHLEVFALVTGIGAALGTGKFEQALMLPKKEKEALGLLWAGQRAVWCTVLIVAVLGIGSAQWVSETWALPGWVWMAWGLPVFVGLAAHSRLLEYWHHRHGRVENVALAQASGPFLSEFTKWVSAGVLPLGGLSWGAGMGIGLKWAVMRKGLGDACRLAAPWHTSPQPEAVKGYRDYPTWVLAGSAMNRLAQWLHVLLIGATLGPLLLGWMGLARRMVLQPLSLLATASAPVLFKSATDRADGAPLRRLFFRSLMVFGTVAALVGGVVALAPDNTTAFLFGEPWRGAMDVVRILTPWFVLNFIAAGLGSMFHRVRKPRWITFLDALHLAAVGIGWYLGTLHPEWFGGGEWGALKGIVWAKCAYYIINVAVLVMAVNRHDHADR
jgi:lipopolysaccharide exporter